MDRKKTPCHPNAPKAVHLPAHGNRETKEKVRQARRLDGWQGLKTRAATLLAVTPINTTELPMPQKQNFLIVVFPEQSVLADLTRLAALATGVIRALTACCGQAPTLVYPDKNKLIMLISGEYTAIVKALDAACQQNDEPWLLTQVGTPCAANGLSGAVAWIQSRCAGR